MPRAGTFQPARRDWLGAAVVAAVLFILYAVTSPRSVALEDDGLFVLSSYFLGIEHPPGYPLFTLLGNLATLLPVGSVAYRVHLVSALFGALTCAMVWMCTRELVPGRLPASVAALGLGFSRTFWSQSVIAEVYTLNTFFLFVLMYLALRAQPAAGAPARRALLPAMALVFGLSLANHWPLMLLAAPGLAVLLWPLRAEFVRRLPLLVLLFVIGLAPYGWMIVRSWAPLPISFYGPLETLGEIWFMVSRSGYAYVDASQTATWLDRTRFMTFFGTELAWQFAILGLALAAVGFWVQWNALGKRISWALTVAFCGPSIILLLLLGFDYDALHKHIFHVYPLPTYGIAALWMGLGAARLLGRFHARPHLVRAACALPVAFTFANGWHWNRPPQNDWTARYAEAFLETLPRDAVVIGVGDSDLIPLAYYHMIEGRRRDITLVQPYGLVLGNRQVHPLRASHEGMRSVIMQRIKEGKEVIVTTLFAEHLIADYARRDSWLFQAVDRSIEGTERKVSVPEPLIRFLEENVLDYRETNGWALALQGELRRAYASLVAAQLQQGRAPDARTARHIEQLSRDFFGTVGLLEGALSNPHGYDARAAVQLLERLREQLPLDSPKRYQSRFFTLRALLREQQRDQQGATADLEVAVSIWPVRNNPAVQALTDAYIKQGRHDAVTALNARIVR